MKNVETTSVITEEDLNDLPSTDEQAEAPAQAEQVDLEALEAKATERVLQRLAQMAEVAGGANATAKDESNLAREIKKLQADGVPALAIERIIALTEARLADEQAKTRLEAEKKAAIGYEQQCWDAVFNALEEVTEAIPQIKDAKRGLKNDLADEVKDLVWNDKRFLDIQKAYQNGQPLPKARIKEAAAMVADGFCKKLGIQKPSGSVDLKSSKPGKDDTASGSFDPERLPRELRILYDINMKHFKDPKKAAQRVREAMR